MEVVVDGCEFGYVIETLQNGCYSTVRVVNDMLHVRTNQNPKGDSVLCTDKNRQFWLVKTEYGYKVMGQHWPRQ